MKAKITAQLINRLQTSATTFEVNDTELRGFLLRVRPSGLMTFFCSYRPRESGKRTRYLIGRHPVLTAAQARDEAKKILADVTRGIDPQKTMREKRTAPRCPTLAQFIDASYAPSISDSLANPKQVIARLRRTFATLLPLPLDALTAWHFEKWKMERHKKGLAPTTINRELAALRSALSKAVDWGQLDAHPMQRVKSARGPQESRIRFLSAAEESDLRDNLDEREIRMRAGRDSFNAWRRERAMKELPIRNADFFVDHLHPMVLLALNTGLRRGELFSLRWSDISLNSTSPQLHVRAAASKSKRARHVPLNKEAQSAMLKWQSQQCAAEDTLVFPGRKGGRLDNINRSWRGLVSSARIRDFRFHDLRHHFASRLVMAGVDLNTVRELLGHADIKMTLRYAHLAPEHKAAAVERISRAA